ncbi:hypothetical protein BGZ76_003170, partial [Entomortierella beljakovae]
MPSVAVTSEYGISNRRVLVIRAISVVAVAFIVAYNFVTSCTPFFSPIFENTSEIECEKKLITAGTEIMYKGFKMVAVTQIDEYSGLFMSGCQAHHVIIQEHLQNA